MPAKTEYSGHWMFICNPAMWEIDEFLSTNIEYDTYKITKWHKDYFHPGQLGIIRVGVDKRTKDTLNGKKRLEPGVYAIVEILSEPELVESSKDGFTIDETLKEPSLRVKIRYLKNLLHSPLLIARLREDKILQLDMTILKGQQASSWPIAKESFNRVLDLIGDQDAILENVEPEITNTVDQIYLLEQKYKNATPSIKEVISRRIERGRIAQEIKKINKYKCKICEAIGEDPTGFPKKDGVPYIETHHVNQVSNLEQGSLGLANLLTLCANHHRQVHFGNVALNESTDDHFIFNIDGKDIVVPKLQTS